LATRVVECCIAGVACNSGQCAIQMAALPRQQLNSRIQPSFYLV